MALNYLKIRNGLTLKPTTLPTSPENGDVYYDSGTNTFQFYENGVFVTFSNNALSNLANVAINTSLLPGVDNSINVGSASFRWTNINALNYIIYGSTSGAITLQAANTTTSYSVKWPSAQGAASSTTLLQNDGSGNLSWQLATAAPTASTVMSRDTNANTQINNLIENVFTTATAAGTTTLTVASASRQQFTGTTTQTVVLPNATTLFNGTQYTVMNRSTGVVTVNFNGGSLAATLPGGSQVTFTLINNGTSAGVWDVTTYPVNTIGTFDGQAGSANGLVISGSQLFAQSATALVPGMVNITTQTFAGAKTFSTSIATPSLLLNGTVSGAITMNAGSTVTPYSITWPAAQSVGTTFLQNNGSGVLSWAAVTGFSGRAGQQAISSGTTSQAVTFSSTLGTTSYGLTVNMKNVTDAFPQFQPLEITAKSATGFTVTWNANTDSANYVLEYIAVPNV